MKVQTGARHTALFSAQGQTYDSLKTPGIPFGVAQFPFKEHVKIIKCQTRNKLRLQKVLFWLGSY